MAAERQKVEVGFGIGQVLSLKLTDKEMKDLRAAVESGGGWYDLETDDGTVSVNLATVVFIRAGTAAQAIGFTGE